jgi:hypothetical protein
MPRWSIAPCLLAALLLQACTHSATRTTTSDAPSANAAPAAPEVAAATPSPAACAHCAVVLRIETLRSSTPAPAAGGSQPRSGTLGGLVGGVVSGGGNAAPAANTVVRYRIYLRMDSGNAATVEQSWLPSGLKAGDPVIVRNGQVSLR